MLPFFELLKKNKEFISDLRIAGLLILFIISCILLLHMGKFSIGFKSPDFYIEYENR